jgi:uncharacterized membrane protein YczE
MTAGAAGPDTGGGPGATGTPDATGRPDGADWTAQGRRIAAVAVLAALMITWAVAPVSGGGPGTRLALIVAVICALASVGRLAIGEEPVSSSPFDPFYVRFTNTVAGVLHALPWAECLVLAVLALEALHHARPWHTAMLGVALLAYVFAVHLAQARTTPAALAGQLPVIAAGVGLLALAVGASALPTLSAGPGSELLRIVAVVAAVLVGGLVLPVAGRRQP